MPASPHWRLTLGRQATLQAGDGRAWPLDGLSALLVARLALAGPQGRDTLARQLWPEVALARGQGNLRQRLLRLKALAGWAWVAGQPLLALAVPVQRLAHEPLLPDLPTPADDALALWLEAEQRCWQQAGQLDLQQRLEAAEAGQQLDLALSLASESVARQPEAEAPRRTLARLHYLAHDGRRAMQELDALAAMLARAHGASADAATQALRRLVEQAGPLAPAAGHATALQRPPRLVGRSAALAELHRALAPGKVVLLLGEAGLGKSRLMAELLAQRPTALHSRAQAGDAGVPHASLARLARRLLAARPRLAGPGLAPLLPEVAASGPATPLHEALVALWQASGQPHTALDDLHFADDASLDALLALTQDERLAGHAWLLALRPAEAPPAAQALRAALAAARRLHPLHLQPLAASEVAELLASLPQPLAWPDGPARLHRHTGGNPFFLLETLRQLGPEAGADAPWPALASVGALLDQRLLSLPPAALSLARLAAVAGADFSPALAAAVGGAALLDLATPWAALEAAGVLRGAEFAHDLMAAAVARSLPAALAASLHAAVAAHLDTQGPAEPARLAAHWLAAGLPERAVPALARAADRAHQQWRPAEEAGFLAEWAALIEAREPAAAQRVLLRLARVQVEAQGFEAATLPLERALHLAGDTADRVQALNLLAEIQFNRLMPEAAARSAEQAHTLASQSGERTATAEALLRWHRALCMAGRGAAAEALWQAHAGALRGVAWPRAELVSDRGWVLDRLGRVREARTWHDRGLAQARAAGRPVDEAVVLGNLAQGLVLAGEPAAAEAVLDRAEALSARHEGLHAASDYLSLYRGMVAAAQGRFSQALGCFDQALAHAGQQSGAARQAVLAHRAVLWAGIGQRARALGDAAEVLRHPALPPWVVARAHHALALASLQPPATGWQRVLDALGDPAQIALDGPPRLQAALLDADPAAALARCRALLHQARRGGHAGLRWAAHWTAAQLAERAGQPATARRHARACLARPAGQAAPLLGEGVWWHGLWRLGLALGDRALADAALALGRDWLAQRLAGHLPEAFQPSFREAVPAHAALLRGTP